MNGLVKSLLRKAADVVKHVPNHDCELILGLSSPLAESLEDLKGVQTLEVDVCTERDRQLRVHDPVPGRLGRVTQDCGSEIIRLRQNEGELAKEHEERLEIVEPELSAKLVVV